VCGHDGGFPRRRAAAPSQGIGSRQEVRYRPATPSRGPALHLGQVQARGKFLFAGEEKLYVRGVTYGAFRPDQRGNEYHHLATIERDFAQMAANGINAVRIPHTTPPRALLDVALRHGLHVMVGLSAEQYVGYLIDHPPDAPDVESLIRARVRSCARHPALLCYALGNEVPASIARWLGPRKIERYLERMWRVVKEEDPAGLVTYVNYPTTEYLRLPFLDLVCFNVYLESQDRFEAYLARLQNVAGERPLVMTEVGLDSLRNGESGQARSLAWQVRTAFAAGCAGLFVFSWTDEWHRHESAVTDWAFGLTRADRSPKPALGVVRKAFASVPFAPASAWPRISVIVCSYNGARTIRDCCEGLARVIYPDYEVIVVDDGSTDATAAIAGEYDVRLIRTPNRGLSNARNTGLAAATGDIVAYIDDDAYPDPHWLTYLAAAFLGSSHAGVGGPNIAPEGDGPIAECVSRSPGGPVHVLLTDREAEHIPGCNMAFRKSCLEAIGGFDPRFRTAGDDVDICWRLRDRGWTLGFHAGAMVWHHRRNSLRAYWRQQIGYGGAEAQLADKWPEKYNGAGHLRWTGRMYGAGLSYVLSLRRPRVHHGVWGSAPFQSLYEPAQSLLGALPQMPEWYLMVVLLACLAVLGTAWSPLRIAGVFLVWALLPPLAQAGLGGATAPFPEFPRRWATRLRRRVLTALLHLIQPVARLRGRIRQGLTPWRRRCPVRFGPLWRTTASVWDERWQDLDRRLGALESGLRSAGVAVVRGDSHVRWDLELRAGCFGAARLLMAVEEHPGAHQLVRLRWWPIVTAVGPVLMVACVALAFDAALDHAWVATAILGFAALLVGGRTLVECTAATGMIGEAVRQSRSGEA
jgi:GT2 family glycosyltransferase